MKLCLRELLPRLFWGMAQKYGLPNMESKGRLNMTKKTNLWCKNFLSQHANMPATKPWKVDDAIRCKFGSVFLKGHHFQQVQWKAATIYFSDATDWVFSPPCHSSSFFRSKGIIHRTTVKDIESLLRLVGAEINVRFSRSTNGRNLSFSISSWTSWCLHTKESPMVFSLRQYSFMPSKFSQA